MVADMVPVVEVVVLPLQLPLGQFQYILYVVLLDVKEENVMLVETAMTARQDFILVIM